MPDVNTESSRIVIRPQTIALVVVAALFFIIAVIYVAVTADALPAFVPGHEAGSTAHHMKHAAAVATLGVLALVGAWFTTAPARDAS